jgi:hypothetical protein
VESIDMGNTTLDHARFRSVISSMQSRWSSEAYNRVAFNCCHFCDTLCVNLGVGRIPHWTNHLANTVARVTKKPAASEDCQKCCAAVSSNPEPLLCCSAPGRPVMPCSSASGQEISGIPTCFAAFVTRQSSFETEALPHCEMTALKERFNGKLERSMCQLPDDGWHAHRCDRLYFT